MALPVGADTRGSVGEMMSLMSSDPQESPMLRKSIYNSPGEPSFFYLMMTESCFRRAARHPQAGTLRNIGRERPR
jgi:hypothetical protein